MPVAGCSSTPMFGSAHLRGADDARHAVALARVEVKRRHNQPAGGGRYYSVMLRNGRAMCGFNPTSGRSCPHPPATRNVCGAQCGAGASNRYGFSFLGLPDRCRGALVAGCTILLTEDLQHGSCRRATARRQSVFGRLSNGTCSMHERRWIAGCPCVCTQHRVVETHPMPAHTDRAA